MSETKRTGIFFPSETREFYVSFSHRIYEPKHFSHQPLIERGIPVRWVGLWTNWTYWHLQFQAAHIIYHSTEQSQDLIVRCRMRMTSIFAVVSCSSIRNGDTEDIDSLNEICLTVKLWQCLFALTWKIILSILSLNMFTKF